jgi:hypothetical protein
MKTRIKIFLLSSFIGLIVFSIFNINASKTDIVMSLSLENLSALTTRSSTTLSCVTSPEGTQGQQNLTDITYCVTCEVLRSIPKLTDNTCTEK